MMRSNVSQAVKMATHYTVECSASFHRDGSKCAFHGLPPLCRERFHQRRTLWRDKFHNLVVTEGLNELLARSFNAVPADVNWYVGLVGAGTGTVAITASANAVTGTGTTFDAGLAVAPKADIIIVGAGAAGADMVDTVASRSSTTALTTAGNAASTVSGASFATEPVAADTLASHINSWAEVVPYSNGTRPAWTKNGAPSGGAMSNSSSKASFSINAGSRIFGLFLASDNTKSGTTGKLYGGGLFTGGSRTVVSGDTLNAQIDLSATAS
jgi:hypothetical protein